MALVNDILAKIEQLAPKSLAEDFDNVGLLLGRGDRQVKKIMVMLDLDKRTINEAIEARVDLVITHHPIIFSPLKSVTDDRLLTLIENNISVISAHTNLDSAPGGVNDVLAELLGLKNIVSINVISDSPLCAKAGDIDKCSFGELIRLVKEKLNIKTVRYIGDLSKQVSKVAVLGGSGGDFVAVIKENGYDAYITADIKYHQAQFADDVDLCVIDAGHFETENPVCRKLKEYLEAEFSDIEVVLSSRKESYIKYE